MSIEEYFRPNEALGKHPLLRLIDARATQGVEARFELHRPREALGFQKGKIYIHFYRDCKEVHCVSDDWDDELNQSLVRRGVRSVSLDAERDRFVLSLRNAFRKPEKRFGDGYFNAVLVKFVRDREELREHPDVAAAMRHVTALKPHEGKGYEFCVEMIQDALQGRAVELHEQLGYAKEAAWNILAGAVAGYLDERFSVTSRRLLGLL